MATLTGIVDSALIYICLISILLFGLILFFMVYFTVRYRQSRNPVPQELHYNPLLEVAWVIVPTIIVLTMFFYGLTGFKFFRNEPKDCIHVKVWARQWSWLFEYDNGRKSPDMVVPVGRNVCCELISTDVIHGFYVPAFRLQQDMVPGLKTSVWFNATELGNNYILCSQYCGRSHSAMIAKIYVVPPDQFDLWMKGKTIPLPGSGFDANMPLGQRLLTERGCLSCHSIYGNKMVGPTFKGLLGSTVLITTDGQPRSIVADSAYIRKSILQPNADIVASYPSTMPSGRDILSDAEIDTIIAYLKTIK
jgi:cytochrome c oxidase subunit II